MARTTHVPKARAGEEIWETLVPGRVWVAVTDDRGREKAISVGPKVGARLRIKSLDREVAQDAILNDDSDPFTNGLLRRVDADQQDEESTASEQVLTTEQLMDVFGRTGMAFQSAVKKLNELNVRRLREMAEALDAKASQIAFLDTFLEENFRAGGDTPTYRELKGVGDTASQRAG
jgi:hypothetical protein